MGKRYYLGIDEGTTGVTAILFDTRFKQAARGYRELTQIYPQPGWVEHDPMDVWNAVLAAVGQALEEAHAQAGEIICIGVDHEGETALIWDRLTGEPVYNAIVWQDKRTAHESEQIKVLYGKSVRQKTALTPDSYFSATKLQWIMRNVEGAQELKKAGRLMAGNMDAWILYKLTGEGVHATDASTASRTMLFNIHTGDWDDALLDLFDLQRDMLPEIHDSAEVYGLTEPNAFFGASVPVSGLLADQQAALFGQACVKPGDIKTTYGTGCFMLMNTGDEIVLSDNGIVATVAWRLKNKLTFALDGGVYVAGAATQWLRDGLGLISSARETERMALEAGGNGGVYFVTAFSGLAAPYNDPYARGMLIGLTGGVRKEHIVRAALEATAYQVHDVLEAMKSCSGVDVNSMRCDGGATANGFLMSFQAGILGIPLEVPEISETTALGSAYMAALGAGEFSSLDEIESAWKLGRRYEPGAEYGGREELLNNWHKAVEYSRGWAR